jgi:antirestriction protein ArdC
VGGYARSFRSGGRPEITLHPRYITNPNANIEEAYGVLVHEIAHIFLGHLGTHRYFIGRNEKRVSRRLCEDRSHLDHNVIELEAELTAWLVFSRFGIEKKSVDYLAGWLVNDEDWQLINFSLVTRVANTIFEIKN